MHPVKMIMMENKLEVHKDKTLREATEIAYKVSPGHTLTSVCRLLDVSHRNARLNIMLPTLCFNVFFIYNLQRVIGLFDLFC